MSANLDRLGERKSVVASAMLGPAFWIAIAVIAGLGAAYHETLATMVAVWLSSETYQHAFIIVPVTCYLVWARRTELASLRAKPNLYGLLPLAALGVLWLLATLADVQVVRQYAMVAMVPIALWAVLGSRVVAEIAFPLAFLLFSVPFGDALIPFLIDLTANATVHALQWTGIPVYREGNSFTIPSGSWSVVEACSGVRYLIASTTLGSLFAYLTFRSWQRRLGFLILSILVPIAANSMRAYLIVMIGHLSNMQLAAGVDHLIYGWIFFSLVMLLLFWLGSFWREDEVPTAPSLSQEPSPASPVKPMTAAAFACLSIALIWPIWASFVAGNNVTPQPKAMVLPTQAGPWQQDGHAFIWKPIYMGSPLITQNTYRDQHRKVSLSIAYYPAQVRGSGLVVYGNALIKAGDLQWSAVNEDRHTVNLVDTSLTVRQTRLFGAGTRILVWRWYGIDGRRVVSPYIAKARLAWNTLLGQPTDGAEIVLAAEFHEKEDEASIVLQAFLAQMLSVIELELDHVRRN